MKCKSGACVDYGAPLNEYLCTEYLYHCICLSCGAVRHDKPGTAEDCAVCGGGCHRRGLGSSSKVAAPWYVQYLDPTCPTCRRTLARLASFDQMELFTQGAA
jgi:hypothetical protein